MNAFALPTVSIGRVDTESLSSYQMGVARVLAHLGGLSKFISSGQRVLIKPDLMHDYPGNGSFMTDPEFVAAVGRLAKDCGATVSIGDSPLCCVAVSTSSGNERGCGRWLSGMDSGW